MKVPTKTSTEDVKVTNLFGDTPPEEEFDWVFEEECPVEWELEYIHEEIVWLAEDILDYGDALVMLWEKIQAVEDDQLQDIKNLSSVVDILGCLQEANKLMLDVIIEQNETIKVLDGKIKNTDNAWLYLFRFLVIWNIVLTVLFWIYVF